MPLIADAKSVFGTISVPEPVANSYGELGPDSPGLTGFISDMVVLISVIGGLWFLINVVIGGLKLITADGDSKKLSEFGTRLSMMVIGLILMVGAPLIAALIGFVIFGDSTSLLTPTITGVGK
jgi:hypothetical protein